MAAEELEHEMTTKAAEYYHRYLLMGSNRSLRKLAAEIANEQGKQSSKHHQGLERYLQDCSQRYGWQRMTREYDDHRRAEQRAQHEQAMKEMNELHWRCARAQYIKSHQRIMEMLERGKLSLYALATISKNAFDAERSARGVDEMLLDLEQLEEAIKEGKKVYE